MIRNGQYRYRVTVQQWNSTTNAWETNFQAWAKRTYLTGSQADDNGIIHAVEEVQWEMRQQSAETLNTKMRILHDSKYYDISSIRTDDKTNNEVWLLECVRLFDE